MRRRTTTHRNRRLRDRSTLPADWPAKAPTDAHSAIASLADPALPLARLRVHGELAEIRAADLRLTPDEAATYLNA